MPARTRTMDHRQTWIGSVTDQDGNVRGTQQANIGEIKVTDDYIGNPTGFNNLVVDRYKSSGGILTGKRFYPFSPYHMIRTFNGLPMGVHLFAKVDPSPIFGLNWVELNAHAMKVLTRTTPEQSSVNVPQFLGELKDFPGMIKSWGDLFLNKNRSYSLALAKESRSRGDVTVANAILTYRWGLAPLISDLSKLLRFQELVHDRFKTLEKLRDGKAIRKQVQLDQGLYTSTSSRFLGQSWEASVYGRWEDTYTHKVWGSIQWRTPHFSGIAKSSDRDLMIRAKKMVLGLNSRSAIQATWELLPWSWLADWFSNLGDVVTNTNSTDLIPYGLCIMQHMTAHRRFVHEDPSGPNLELAVEPFEAEREFKLRYANVFPVAFPSLRLPILTNSKLSIIGSLATLRLPEGFKKVLRSR